MFPEITFIAESQVSKNQKQSNKMNKNHKNTADFLVYLSSSPGTFLANSRRSQGSMLIALLVAGRLVASTKIIWYLDGIWNFYVHNEAVLFHSAELCVVNLGITKEIKISLSWYVDVGFINLEAHHHDYCLCAPHFCFEDHHCLS